MKKTRPKEETYNKLTRQRASEIGGGYAAVDGGLADVASAAVGGHGQAVSRDERAVFDVGCESGTLYGLSLGYV